MQPLHCVEASSATPLQISSADRPAATRPLRFTLQRVATTVAQSNARPDQTSEGLADTCRLAHALRGLEFDLAGDQDRPERSAADFICRLAICGRGNRLARHFHWPHLAASATSLRVFRSRLQRAANVFA